MTRKNQKRKRQQARNKPSWMEFPRAFAHIRPTKGRSLWWEYEDVPIEAEEYWGFRYHRRPRTRLPLDKVAVAQCLRISIILRWMLALSLLWLPWVKRILSKTAQDQGWCNWHGKEKMPMSARDRAHTKTREEMLNDLEELCEQKVMESVDNANPENRYFFSFFKVAKACGAVARAIANCKVLAQFFGKPPQVRFITPHDLFRLIAYFNNPHFAELDFRHWFYQIPLPQQARRFFSTQCGEKVFQLAVWPMGFKWTPVLAQAITMTITAQAIQQAGFIFKNPLDAEGEVPPYWIVEDQQGNVVAFVVAYLDNILVIAACEQIRDQLSAGIKEACQTCNAQIKETADGSTIRHTKNEVAFLGVRFSSHGKEVHWKHNDVSKWAHVNPKAAAMLRREVAEIIGIIIWHWTLTNTPITTIKGAVRIASDIGKLCETHEDWDNIFTPSMEQREVMSTHLAIIRQAGEVWQKYEQPMVEVQEVWPTASDSSKAKGAWMTFDIDQNAILAEEAEWLNYLESLRYQKDYFQEKAWNWKASDQENLSINRKETYAVLRLLKEICEKKAKSDAENNHNSTVLVPIGIDNTTACTAIRNWYFPADDQLSKHLEKMYEKTKRLRIRVIPVQVKSEEEAADSATRDEESTHERRIATLKKLRWAVADCDIRIVGPLMG